jgi:hypothetical protein
MQLSTQNSRLIRNLRKFNQPHNHFQQKYKLQLWIPRATTRKRASRMSKLQSQSLKSKKKSQSQFLKRLPVRKKMAKVKTRTSLQRQKNKILKHPRRKMLQRKSKRQKKLQRKQLNLLKNKKLQRRQNKRKNQHIDQSSHLLRWS